ncbi:MAG: hypothetical protein M0R22_12320 [Dehalococcoidia bacterium]|jgi:hypothetical protein|nr:hypothetical protein [Dehalococcoidia bacterium]
MMKKALLLVCALLVLPGCSSMVPQSNQPPEADIVSIAPAQVAEGQTVTFTGQGTDADGEVVGYLWRSDRDGELSRLRTFTTDSLSVGEHAIYLKVQDNNDAWSDEVEGSVKVVTAVAVKVNSFTVSPSTIEPGDDATLSWDVSGATSVSIDRGIGAVATSGSETVSPEATTTYTLTAIGAGPAATASVTVTVEQAVRRITLSADSNLSGYVRWSGVYRTVGIYVGDDQSNRGIQGFLTYNISRIPDDATITSVVVDMSEYDIPYDLPFPELGCLSAYVQSYSTLYGAYWMDDVDTSIGEWCDLTALDTPAEQSGFRRALQRRVGDGPFQFRLQFADKNTDSDDVQDLLHWQRDFLPRLIVEYQVD